MSYIFFFKQCLLVDLELLILSWLTDQYGLGIPLCLSPVLVLLLLFYYYFKYVTTCLLITNYVENIPNVGAGEERRLVWPALQV